jgi:hypothetical protein
MKNFPRGSHSNGRPRLPGLPLLAQPRQNSREKGKGRKRGGRARRQNACETRRAPSSILLVFFFTLPVREPRNLQHKDPPRPSRARGVASPNNGMLPLPVAVDHERLRPSHSERERERERERGLAVKRCRGEDGGGNERRA